MRYEDGYCDRCGAEVDTPQLTVDGLAVCTSCTVPQPATAKRPEARDDGR